MNANSSGIETLRLLGGRLCLDFINTLDPRIGNHPHDLLSNYADLVHWSLLAGLNTKDEGEHLLREAAHRPTEATRAFERAITLRETLYRIFVAISRNSFPTTTDLDMLRTAFAEAVTDAQLIPAAAGLQWDWTKKPQTLIQMLWPIVHSAVELVTSAESKKVKECPGVADCGWLFLDTSKNGSRQWCSMEGCGSRAKMRRQYARKRSTNRDYEGAN